MANKKNTFLVRGEEAQRERHSASAEYEVNRREEEVMRKAAEQAHLEGRLEEAAMYTAQANSSRVSADIQDITSREHRGVIDKQFRRSVRTAINTRSTKEDVARHMQSTANYGAASESAHRYSTSELHGQLSSVQEQRGDLRQGILADSRTMTNMDRSPTDRAAAAAALSTKWQSLESLAHQEGTAKAGLAIQKRQGVDLASIYENTAGVLARAKKDTIAQEAISGKYGSSATITDDFNKKLKELSQSFDQLTTVLHDSTATLDQKNAAEKAHKKAADEFDNASLKKAAIDKAGVPTGGWATAASLIQSAGVIAQAGGAIGRQWGVTREMDRTQMMTGYIDIANARFFDNVAASQGDAAAIGRIKGGQHKRSLAFASKMGDREVAASFTEAAGAGLMVGGALLAGGLALSSTGVGATVGIPLMAAGVGALIASQAGGIEQTSGKVAKLQSGAARAGAELPAFHADKALFAAERASKDYVNQIALDYTMNTNLATRGAGGGRTKLMEELRDPGFMKTMAGLEIDKEGMLSLGRTGIAHLGGQFRGKEDIQRAGELSKMGLTSSPEEYLGLRGQTERAGVGPKGLEEILQKAVAAGLDTSKHIGELVQGIGSIASVRGGVSTFGGAAENMALTVQGLRAGGMSQSMAVQAAADINMSLSSAASDKGLTIQNLVEQMEIQKIAPGADLASVNKVRSMTPEQFRSVTSAFNTSGETAAKVNQGVNNFTNDQIKNIYQKSGESAISTIIGVGMNTDMEGGWKDVAGGRLNPAVGSPEYNNLLNHYNSMAPERGYAPIAYGTSLSTVADQFRAGAKAKDTDLDKNDKNDKKDYLSRIIPSGTHITSDQGHRDAISLGGGRYSSSEHKGIDLAGAEGTGIASPFKGKLKFLSSGAFQIVEKGGGGLIYRHSTTKLKEGAEVEAGQTFAAIGAKDEFSTAAHLHAEYQLPGGGLGDTKKHIQEGADVGDIGSRALQAKATGGATAYEKGLEDLAANVKIMSEAALKIDPENFRKVIDSSAETIGKTLDDLNEAVGGLKDTVTALNSGIKVRLQDQSNDGKATTPSTAVRGSTE